MAITPAYTGTGLATGAVPAGGNPYQLDPQTLAFLQALQGVGGAVGGGLANPNAATQFQRNAPFPMLAQGQPNNLLLAILQMRAQEASALGAPYQQGTALNPPRYSLLSG